MKHWCHCSSTLYSIEDFIMHPYAKKLGCIMPRRYLINILFIPKSTSKLQLFDLACTHHL